MHDEEEIRPRTPVGLGTTPLDPFSITDLQAYIAALRAEIARAEAAIARKQGARGHADSFFKF